jgi:isochorismate pyruvate lyase
MRTVGQFLDHPQLEARDRWREVGSPVGPLRALVPPAILAGTEPVMKPIPRIGEHTGEILSTLGDRREDGTDGDGGLGEVRESIDAVDREIVRLLAEREGYVRRAAHLKETRKEVEAPDRVEEVVRNARTLAGEHGANPDVAEGVYRAMITCFVSLEMDEHAQNKANKEEGLRP